MSRTAQTYLPYDDAYLHHISHEGGTLFAPAVPVAPFKAGHTTESNDLIDV